MLPPEVGVPRATGPPLGAGPLRASLGFALQALRLLLEGPARRRRLRAAYVRLGAVLADYLAGAPAPGPLARLLSRRRAVEIDLAALDPSVPPAGRRPASRVERHRAGPGRGLAGLRRTVLRWRALARLRAIDAELGAAALRMGGKPPGEVGVAFQAAQAAKRTVEEAPGRIAASWREARRWLAVALSRRPAAGRTGSPPAAAVGEPEPPAPRGRPPAGRPAPPVAEPSLLERLGGWEPAGNGGATADRDALTVADQRRVGEEFAWPGRPLAHRAARPAPPRGSAADLAHQLKLAALVVARRIRVVVTALADPPRLSRSWTRLVRPVAAALALALSFGALAALPAGTFLSQSVKAAEAGLPQLSELRPIAQADRSLVYDRKGRLLKVLRDEENRIVLRLDQVPAVVRKAVVAAEDARFFEHRGVDNRSVLRAVLSNLGAGQTTQGGSTITQQFVRNAYPDLKDRSLIRKVKEATLAAQLEHQRSKEYILEGYLNRVYFGKGFYGVGAAAYGYFSVSLLSGQRISLAQAATLAGIIRSPETANPLDNPKEALRLRNQVLDRMVGLGLASPADAQKARRAPLKPVPGREPNQAPHFVEEVRRQLLDDPRLGRTRADRVRMLYEGGLRIRTTLDLELQHQAEEAVKNHRPAKGPDAALVAVDPRDGGVRAMVGGRSFTKGQYNLATQGGRQPGSSFKTFVLAEALNRGISPDSVWDGSPFPEQQEVCGRPWKVSNATSEGGATGGITVRQATAQSVNGVFARLMEKLCPPEAVAAMAKRLGVSRVGKKDWQEREPSIALGAAEVLPIDMASAYATLAADGYRRPPVLVTAVYRRGGKLLLENKPQGEQAVSRALAYEVVEVLKGVTREGTGVNARIGWPHFGKTGTAQDYRDAWFVGATRQLSTAVWMGVPTQLVSMTRREFPDLPVYRVTGGSLPARIWRDFMVEAMDGEPGEDWQAPDERLSFTILPPAPPQTTFPGPPPPVTQPGPFPGPPPRDTIPVPDGGGPG